MYRHSTAIGIFQGIDSGRCIQAICMHLYMYLVCKLTVMVFYTDTLPAVSHRQEPLQPFRPLPSWGPGDKEARRRLINVRGQLMRQDQLHGADNAALEME